MEWLINWPRGSSSDKCESNLWILWASSTEFPLLQFYSWNCSYHCCLCYCLLCWYFSKWGSFCWSWLKWWCWVDRWAASYLCLASYHCLSRYFSVFECFTALLKSFLENLIDCCATLGQHSLIDSWDIFRHCLYYRGKLPSWVLLWS